MGDRESQHRQRRRQREAPPRRGDERDGRARAGARPGEDKQANQAIAEQQDKTLQLNQAREGGNQIERQQIANLEAELAGRRNAVEEQKNLVAAIERQLALTHSAQEQARLERELLQAKVELQNRMNAAKESELRLKSKNADDPKAQRDAALALAAFHEQTAGDDVVKHNEALQEKEDAEATYAESVKRLTMQDVSRPFGEIAETLVKTLPRNPERTVALRKLLEAKDAAVRARLFK